MRDSARIDRVLALLGTHWKQHPDLRLGQIVSNIAQRQGIADVFYMEEAAIERDLLAEHEQTPALQVGQAGGEPFENLEEFRPGLPSETMRKVCDQWEIDLTSREVMYFHGDTFRVEHGAWVVIGTVDWSTVSLRPNGKTWAEVEQMARQPANPFRGPSALPGGQTGGNYGA